MANALWITLIGMGLVFLAILLLWGLMALLVRLTAERPAPQIQAAEAPLASSAGDEQAEAERLHALRRKAAVAAVSAALAVQKKPAHHHQPSGGLSAWQAVHRASQLSQRANSARKQVAR